ncbi:AAA family ATPase [Microbacterium rhizosphaerae]|uniref:AAA family ATPase n=1 Tax=Microbacterium rhizosphaerae TaxID=1678237 RepID=A0ABZ0SPX7_9MICO|nr:AAA family ATPase [Microbacterium rhizosphaerae]WPR89702.1 AAA family ATPase [Microbacterium rhizosphaerae]
MRGGLERWKRGVESHGVRQALAYAFDGTCDAHLRGAHGVQKLENYSGSDDATRYTVSGGAITADLLDSAHLARWLNGDDPETGEHRGRHLDSPTADLVLDGTINAPKSFSIAALIDVELASQFEALQDRLRDRIILTWQKELNARRGAGGRIRESLQRIEVVELQHRRSRALDPHIHRHLWLNVKVQGEDGQWSNVDSRVAMKLHTVINAEGELAARTDTEWVDALARRGYTLNEDGEIAQLAHLVRPLSRRANQIEANRMRHLAEWRSLHPQQEPSAEVLAQIDRWAWASGRPNKPNDLDESTWEAMIRDELTALDPGLWDAGDPIEPSVQPIAALDRDLLAVRAIADADRRAAHSGGRFSRYDIQAGAMRAVASCSVQADRPVLQEVIEDIVERALRDSVDLLHDQIDVPSHVKHLMSAATAALKLDLVAKFDVLNRPGTDIPRVAVTQLSATVLEPNTSIDPAQSDAAGAIGGTCRLVTVSGPAGSGKTTILRVAQAALARQGRRMIVVAPTKKAASVAGREIGAAASSLHALLVDHGWRFADDDSGAQIWTRLRLGDVDASTGAAYAGPQRYPLAPGDRIVVDESGMVDLATANLLAEIALETGAGIAMVGDDLQARPVGHSGAMACMARRSGAVVELSAVHRFRDPDYGALTIRMRLPATLEEAAAVAHELGERGCIRRVDDEDAARQAMVVAYFEHARPGHRVALVTATNADAAAVSEEIQQRRIALGQLHVEAAAAGMGEQCLLIGDLVQTRRNDRLSGVENRATWTIEAMDATYVWLASVDDAGDHRVVSRDYASEHIQLAYASTVHGIQGETTDISIVGPGVDAAGFYVGMTRGRFHNEALVTKGSSAEAERDIAETLMRGTIEVTLDDARASARSELGRAARPRVVRQVEDAVGVPDATTSTGVDLG